MSLELTIPSVAFWGPEWVAVGIVIVAIALIAWETWESKSGNNRPELKITVGLVPRVSWRNGRRTRAREFSGTPGQPQVNVRHAPRSRFAGCLYHLYVAGGILEPH
jgi:hypothetical protein